MRIVVAAALPIALCAMLGLARAADPDALPEQIVAGSVERAELDRLLQEARAQGLPREILLAKIREGVAKHVPPARLVMVTRTLAERLREAQGLVRVRYGGLAPASELTLCRAVLDARAVGLDLAELAAVLRGSRTEGIAFAALSATTDLVARGFPKSSSLQTVLSVAQRQPGALENLAADVDGARARGATAIEALQLGGAGELRGNGKKGNATSGSSGNGEPNDNSETRGPERETIGPRGKALGASKGKGNNNKP